MYPNNTAVKTAIKKAAGHDEPHFVWGLNLQPKEGDPRLVENRVICGSDGRLSALEVHRVTRKADSSARQAQVATADWPGAA